MASFPPGDRLVFHDAEVHEILDSQHGPAARDLLRRGLRVEGAAKNFATGVGGGPRVRTGRLRSSISTALSSDAQGVYVDVGSNVKYAGYLELGTRNMHARPFLRPALPAAIG